MLSGSWLAIALKMGRSGNVEAIRICCSRDGTAKLFQLGRATEAVEKCMRRRTLVVIIVG